MVSIFILNPCHNLSKSPPKEKKILLNNLDIHPPEKDSRSVQGSYSVIFTSGLKAYLK